MNSRALERLSTKQVIIALTTLLLALVLAPGVARAASAEDYGDLEKNAWYMTDGWVPYAVEKGLMTGYDNGSFGPYDDITRGQVAVIIYRYENGKTAETTDNAVTTSFKDVPSGKYYSAAVKWANEKGIVTGFSKDKFAPEDPVTREQLGLMIARYAGLKQTGTAKPQAVGDAKFTALADHGQVSDWAKDGMVWCTYKGVIEGVDSNGTSYLKPQDKAWRASMAKIMKVTIENVLKGGGNDPGNGGGNGGGSSNAIGQISLAVGSVGSSMSFYYGYMAGSLVTATCYANMTVKDYSGPLEIVYTTNGVSRTHTVTVAKNTKYNLSILCPVTATPDRKTLIGFNQWGMPNYITIPGTTTTNTVKFEAGGASCDSSATIQGRFNLGALTVTPA